MGGRGADDLTVQQQQNSFGPDLARHFLLIHFDLIWNLISSVDWNFVTNCTHLNERERQVRRCEDVKTDEEQPWAVEFFFSFFFLFRRCRWSRARNDYLTVQHPPARAASCAGREESSISFWGPRLRTKKIKKKKEKKRRIDHLWNVAHTIAWLFNIFKHKPKSAHLKLKKKNEREREKQQPTNKKWNYIRNQWMEEKKKRRNDNDTSSYWNVRCLACGHVTWATEKYQENSSSFWIHLAARSSFFGPTSQPPSLWIHMHQKPNEWHER